MKYLKLLPITTLAAIGVAALTEGRPFLPSFLVWVVYFLAIQFIVPDD